MLVDADPILPVWMIVLLTCALAALLAHGSRLLLRKRVPVQWVWSLGALRVVAIVLFVACLVRPVLSRSISVERKPELLVLVDTSRSLAGVNTPRGSRLSQAADQMREGGLSAALRKNFDASWFAFDDDARPIEDTQLNSLTPDGESTDIGASLRTALDYWRLGSDRIGQEPPDVLLLSDGYQQGAGDAVEIARDLGVKVHTLAPPEQIGPAQPARVEIAAVQSPRRVLLGAECRFRVSVRHTGGAAPSLALALAEDQQPAASQTLAFADGQAEQQVTLVHRPTSIGPKRYRFTLEQGSAGKSSPVGKPYELSVEVVGRNHTVLVLEETFRWEFKFLQRVLEDDPNFVSTAFLSRGSGIYMQMAEPENPVKLGGFPQSQAELDWFDIIILGNVSPRKWPPKLAAAINDAVVKQGKSLIVIAGPEIEKLAETPLLESLLPVEIGKQSGRPIQGPIAVRISAEGSASSPFYVPRGDKQAKIWAHLPPLDQIYAPLRKRPAATTLLESSDRSNESGSLIITAEHTVGRGRVLFVGTDTLWKWQTLGESDEAGNTPYRVFWQQALRALAPLRPSAAGENLWVQTDRTKYTAGQTVKVYAELPTAGAARERSQPIANVKLPDGRELPLTLLPDPARQGAFRAEFAASQPGNYQIRGELRSQRSATQTLVAVDVEPAATEAPMPDNSPLLRRIAAATGGQQVDPARSSTWPRAQSGTPRMVNQTRLSDLWSNFSLLLTLMAVLSVDWLLRLLRGFV